MFREACAPPVLTYAPRYPEAYAPYEGKGEREKTCVLLLLVPFCRAQSKRCCWRPTPQAKPVVRKTSKPTPQASPDAEECSERPTPRRYYPTCVMPARHNATRNVVGPAIRKIPINLSVVSAKPRR